MDELCFFLFPVFFDYGKLRGNSLFCNVYSLLTERDRSMGFVFKLGDCFLFFPDEYQGNEKHAIKPLRKMNLLYKLSFSCRSTNGSCFSQFTSCMMSLKWGICGCFCLIERHLVLLGFNITCCFVQRFLKNTSSSCLSIRGFVTSSKIPICSNL